jgi:alkanesulfonate monooxygenase SsuD/methylene tetrahydromethanopterin reductase-like flavin-dependent oxidoreductase (luciferase family)
MAAVKEDIPVYTASITPAGLAASGEVADGVFPVFMVPENFAVIGEHLQKGFDKAGNGKSLANFDVAPFIGHHGRRCRCLPRANQTIFSSLYWRHGC